MKIKTQLGWDEIKNPQGVTFYRKRGITNGVVDVYREESGWMGSFIPDIESKEEYHRIDKIFPDTYTGIIDCKIAISTWHGKKYVVTKYESHSQIIHGGRRKNE